ncbi:hypothetical protein JD76_06433 [Micromonospora endolithica]|nr:hypothetical protein JD76_06433 [Micromonospora endolithica]
MFLMVTEAVNPPCQSLVVYDTSHWVAACAAVTGMVTSPPATRAPAPVSARARRGPDSLLHTFMPLISLGESGRGVTARRNGSRGVLVWTTDGADGDVFRVPDPDGRWWWWCRPAR